MTQRAFTLVEILVVILIISILAAIALPQYQKVVEKSKAAQAFGLLRSLQQAERVYTMTTGTYPSKFAQLDTKIPLSAKASAVAGNRWYTGAHDALANKEWSAQIVNYSYWHMLSVGRISGPYQGAGWVIYEKYKYYNYPQQVILCVERKNSSDRPFTKNAGDYCKKIFHGTRIGTTDTYRLP